MKFIPVLDLLDGKVVHARRGERSSYASIQSLICKGCNPRDVATALLDIFPFSSLYIADLNSIQDRGNNRKVITGLLSRFPDLELWVDCGIAKLCDYLSWKRMRLGQAVIGTENHPEPGLLRVLNQENSILSLDFRADQFVGPLNLDQQPEIWPEEVIVMTLTRVGSNLGPDLKRLAAIKKIAPSKNIIAAGGVSSVSDLEDLSELNVAGVMLATALHEGHIKRNDIERFSLA